MDMPKTTDLKALRIIFYIQIGLIALMGILFILGSVNAGVKVGAFFFTIILGALGASVSLLRQVLDRSHFSNGLDDPFKIFTLVIPIMYGTVMAGIAYLLFMSGILSGDGGNGLLTTNLFPNFDHPEATDMTLMEEFRQVTPDGMQNTGKLLVWCFLAGYSERFVTGILRRLEQPSVGG